MTDIMRLKQRIPIRKFLNYRTIAAGIILLTCVAIGLFPSLTTIISAVLALCVLVLIRNDDFYALAAVFLLFSDQFVLGQSSPVYRIFSYLILIKFIIELPKARFKTLYFPILAVLIVYSLFAMGGSVSMRWGLNLVADVMVSYFIILRIRNHHSLFERFLILYVLCAILAGLYGVTAGKMVEYDVGRASVRSESIFRYYGTVGDPNYVGFFYNIAIAFVLCGKSFRKWYVKAVLLVPLYYFMLIANSMTTFLCNIILIILYIIIRYRKKAPPILGAIAFLGVLLLIAILTVPALEHISVFNNIKIRVNEQFRYLRSGRMDMATSDRTVLWSYFWDYFQHQSTMGKLFGGNIITSYHTLDTFTYKACHMVYLQALLDFGILGAVIFVGTILIKAVHNFFRALTDNSERVGEYRILFLVTFVWIFFGLSIDMLIDWRFMFFYFL